MAIYLGFDVLEIEPSDTGAKQEEYQRSLQRIDSLTGGLEVLDRSGVAVLLRSGFVWAMHGRAEIAEYKAWLADRKGALVPFWVPTWRHDVVMASDLASGATTFSIHFTGYTEFQFPLSARQYLAFLLPDGTKYCRRVIDATDEEDGNETLTLDTSIPVDVLKAEAMACFLTLCRLAADDPELVWSSTRTAEATLQFVELPQEAAALDEEVGS